MTELDRVVAEHVHAVRERIRRAGGVDVRLLAVTKTFTVEHCWAAHRAGCDGIGENFAQELVAKFGGGPPPFAVHFIGRLQSNKVRMLAGLVDVYETIDRRSLVAELARRAPGAAMMVQVAPDSDPGKGGCAIGEVPQLVESAIAAGLDVRGLMTVGPTHGGPVAARPGFRAVRALVDRLGLAECSMGMSADLEVAVEEGSTQVRVGSALFGERPVSPGAVR